MYSSGLSGLITPSLDEMAFVAQEMERAGLRVPLLTTSKMHTAVKIAPQYSFPVVHVLDASRAVVVVSTLLDPATRPEYAADVQEEYQEMRKEYLDALQDSKFLSLSEARRRRLDIDWTPAPSPQWLGPRSFTKFPLSELLPYIDW